MFGLQVSLMAFLFFHFTNSHMAISVESTAAYVATRSISPEKLTSIVTHFIIYMTI